MWGGRKRDEKVNNEAFAPGMCPGILMIPETHEIVRRLVFRARKIFCNCIKRIGCEECFAFAEYDIPEEFKQ